MTTFDVVYLYAAGLRRVLHPNTASLVQQRAHYRVAGRLMHHVAGALARLADAEPYSAASTGSALVCAAGLRHAEAFRLIDDVNDELRMLRLPVSIDARVVAGLTRFSGDAWGELTGSRAPKRDPADYVPAPSSLFARLAEGGERPPVRHLAGWLREVGALGPALSDRDPAPATRSTFYVRGDVHGQGRALTHDAPDLAAFRARSEAVTGFFDQVVPRIASRALSPSGLLLLSVSDDVVAVDEREALDAFTAEVTAAFSTLGLGRFTFATTALAPSEPLTSPAARAADLLVRARAAT